MNYAFIERNRRYWPMSLLCEVLGVSPSGYHQRRQRAARDRPCRSRVRDDALLAHIKPIHAEVKGEYGWPRMWNELLARGVCVGKERVRKLIAQHGIRARHKRKYIASTNSNHGLPFAPNLLKRNFNFSRAVSVENIQLMRAPLAFRSCSQAATSVISRSRLSMRRSRHWLRSTPISISTMLSQLACLGV